MQEHRVGGAQLSRNGLLIQAMFYKYLTVIANAPKTAANGSTIPLNWPYLDEWMMVAMTI